MAGGFGFLVGGACGLAGAGGSLPGPVGGGNWLPGDGAEIGGDIDAQAATTSAVASATRARRAGIGKVAIIGVGGGSE